MSVTPPASSVYSRLGKLISIIVLCFDQLISGPQPVLAPPILKQPILSQLPTQATSTKAFHAASFVTEERNPVNSPSNLDWMMPNSSLKRSPLMRKKHPVAVLATSRNAFQTDSFIPEKRTVEIRKPIPNSSLRRSPSISTPRKKHQPESLITGKRTPEIRKPANFSNNLERRMPNSSQKRKSLSSSPERMEITPAVVPPPPTCEKKGKDILEEIQDAEVQKEPAPTIYSRLKNVVAEAIQKVWSIFQ